MKVLVFGNANADINVRPVDAFDPGIDTTFIDDIELHNGGNAMTAAMVMRRLGVPCALATFMGGHSDPFSAFLMDRLSEAGVDTSLIECVEGETCGIVIVMVSSEGKRFFFYKKGVQNLIELRQNVLQSIPDYDIVSVHGTFIMPRFDGEGTMRLFREAKRLGKTTVLDATPDTTGGWLKTIGCVLPYCDYFLPSLLEARGLTGLTTVEEMAEFLLRQGPGAVVVKLGDRGCYYKTAHEQGYIPAYPVTAVDTTGAGDCFCGGFISTLDRSMPLPERLQFAAAVGALSVTQMGAVGGVNSQAQVLEFMRRGGM